MMNCFWKTCSRHFSQLFSSCRLHSSKGDSKTKRPSTSAAKIEEYVRKVLVAEFSEVERLAFDLGLRLEAQRVKASAGPIR